MAPWIHPNTTGLPTVVPRTLVRSGPVERAFVVIPGGILLAALVLPWASAEDRIGANVFAAALLVGSVGLATSRWESQGPFLVGVGAFVVHSVAAPYVAEVDSDYGVAIVRADGTRLQLGALTYPWPLPPGGRRARRVALEAAMVQRWAAALGDVELPPGARAWTTDPRWGVFGWMLVVVVLAPALSWGLTALS